MKIFAITTRIPSPVPDPSVTVLCICAFLLLAFFLSIKKTGEKRTFLDFTTTQQLKGLSVLLVVLEHLRGYVIEVPTGLLRTGPWGFAVFVVLSGFGLERSHKLKNLKLGQFVRKRVNRVFVPYWFAGTLFLVLDYYILSKTYSLSFLAKTFMGINFDVPTNLLFGGIRWFITFILFYYVVFFISTCFQKKITRILILFLVPTLVCFLDPVFELLGFVPVVQNRFYSVFCLFPYKYYTPWKYFFLLFPFGCILGMYFESIVKACEKIIESRIKTAFLIVLSILAYLFFSKISSYLIRYCLAVGVPIHLKLIASIAINLRWILAAISMILIFNFLRLFSLYSRFLSLTGLISYELFLIHSVFMNKYDFIFYRLPAKYAFVIFLIVMCFFAFCLKQSSGFAINTVSSFNRKRL